MDGESFFRGLILFLMADILVMLLIWIFFYGLPRWKRNKRPAQRNPQDRDRYIPLISCIILLVAVEGFLFKLARVTFMTGNQYAVRTVIGFVFIDAILLLSILPFLTGIAALKLAKRKE